MKLPHTMLLWTVLLLSHNVWRCAGQEQADKEEHSKFDNNGVEEVECPPGTELVGADTENCIPCRLGFYRPENHTAKECVPCPPNLLTRERGAVSIDNCTQHVGSRANCPSGTEWVSDNEDCQPCPVGTYRAQGEQFWCLRCPEGRLTQTKGSITVDNCTIEDCPSGTEWVSEKGQCELCPRNTYRRQGQHGSCNDCPPYHITLLRGAASEDQCYELPPDDELFLSENCPSGTQYNVVPGVCVPCLLGWYRTAGVHDICRPCPAGTSTLMYGAISEGLCMTPEELQNLVIPPKKDIVCPPGTEWSTYPAGCMACPLGTYLSDQGSRLCKQCPEASKTPGTGAKTKELCGLTVPPDNSTIFSKNDCPPGTRWYEALQACLVCQRGYFSPDGELCVPCPENTTTLYHAAVSVRDCRWPRGQRDEQPFFDSDQCPLGSEWDSEAQGCRACPGGLYRSDPISTSCSPCPLTSSTLRPGAKTATLCTVPLQVPTTSPLTHAGCQPGYEPSLNNSSCLVCTHGYYKSAEGWSPCQPCPTDARGRQGQTKYTGATHINDCLPEVGVLDISPSYGPMAGGTNVTVTIDAALPLRLHTLSLAGYPCRPISHYFKGGKLTCHTSPSRGLMEGTLNMKLVNYEGSITAEKTFTYKPDPEISKVSRTKAFQSGGVVLTVRGVNMNSVTKPLLTLSPRKVPFQNTDFRWPCYIMDAERMECPLPDMQSREVSRVRRSYTVSAEDEKPKEYDLGFLLDGQNKYNNMTDRIGAFQIYQDPVFYRFEEDKVEEDLWNNERKIEIKGRRLNLGCTKEDINVTVGEKCRATVDDLQADHLISTVCADLSRGTRHQILVTVGSLSFMVGYVHMAAVSGVDELDILLPVLLGLGSAFLLIGLIVGACVWRRRKLRRSDSTRVLAASTSSLASSPAGSLSNKSSSESGIPPLPVDSIFGPERLTDKGVAMRPLALPSDGLAVQMVEQSKKGKLLRYNVTWDEAKEARFSTLSNDTDISGFQSQRV